MRAATKALMIASARGGNQGGYRGGRSEMEMAMPYMVGTYEMEDRFRDRRGREHYNNGRFAPRGEWDEGMMANYPRMTYPNAEEPEVRYNYPNRVGYENQPRNAMDEVESRRRRYSRNRTRSEMEEEDVDKPKMHYPAPSPFPGPVYERMEGGSGMNPIGFAANPGFREVDGDYKQDAEYKRMNEMEYRKDPNMMRGGAYGSVPPLDEEMAHEWMKGLKNEDGTRGPHWSKEQVKQVMKQQNWDVDELEAWVALNAVYSDYFNVARKNNVNNLNFYVDLAKAFMGDKDAEKDKLALYYCYIVK